MMKKFTFKLFLVAPLALLWFAACDDTSLVKHADAGASLDAGVSTKPKPVPGVCAPKKCPQPKAPAIACCTPGAECGTDPTGVGLGCVPNPDTNAANRVCVLKDCAAPLNGVGKACCTPLADCGWDPFGNGVFCFEPAPPVATDAAPLCDLSKCSAPDGGVKPCCQLSGECGFDALGIGLCFPPPQPLCDLSTCPDVEGGKAKCCQLNGKCGVDALGIGLCFAPPADATCDLSTCPTPANGIKACCQPDGTCGWDSLNIGICFPPPPPPVDAGKVVVPPPIVTTPPDDPSITRECPSFIGLFGPQWGCCSAYGVCGSFIGGQCALAIGAQIPNGPPPPADAGKTEPFLRCTPPAKDAAAH
ncbi:MAG TPA: hypothetical protein VF395_09390 [Polyangiaceae bacterium]